MSNGSVKERADRKSQMAWVLFLIFVVIFSVTAIFAFIALGYAIFVQGWLDADASRKALVLSLLGFVVFEVAAGVAALWKDLFGLSSKGDVSNLSNTLSEFVDFLEADGDISEERANLIREQYAGIMGVSGSAMGG